MDYLRCIKAEAIAMSICKGGENKLLQHSPGPDILTYLRTGGGQFAAMGVHGGTSAQQLLENTTSRRQCQTKYVY